MTVVGSSPESTNYTNNKPDFEREKVEFKPHHDDEKRLGIKKIYCKAYGQDSTGGIPINDSRA